ncbi:MAG: TraR/DksA family transcriptional regulator [Ferruginibacter sp.]|nr:TraR/DksA family transcriptional regulator [Ferruginibacter sp.]
MATKKPAKKVATKKPAAKIIKKVAAKKTVKPAAKPSKPAAKKTVVKPLKKSVAKKTVAKKPVVNKTAKPIQKKTVPAKSSTSKKNVIVAKKTPHAVVKKVAVTNKKEQIKKPEVKAIKKEEVKKSGIKAIAKNPKDIKIPAPKPVVVPKINTKSSRTYKPDFTKSVLDKVKNNPASPTNRYSDSELLEFKELVHRKLETAKKELHYLQGLITRKDDMGGDESENRYMTMEDGSLSMEREQLSQMASRQITFIDHLEKALMRIENKTYGICRVTGKLIDKARLRAVPHATLSIEAKMGMTK